MTIETTVIATDEGTHGGPDTFRVVERDGKMTLFCKHGSGVVHQEDVSWEGLGAKLAGLTEGRVRWLKMARSS